MRTDTRVIRVASVPSGHVYVRHIGDPLGRDGAIRLDDPRRCHAPSGSQQWWPPVMLDPRWVHDHHDEFDVFHIHFGFDAQEPGKLGELFAGSRRYGKPLAHTVHDLRNPHHGDTRAPRNWPSPPTSASTAASRPPTAHSGPGWCRTRCRWPDRCGRSTSSVLVTHAIPPRGAPRSAGRTSGGAPPRARSLCAGVARVASSPATRPWTISSLWWT